METIHDSQTSDPGSESDYAVKTASAPIRIDRAIGSPDETQLKTQISAPSCLFSLKENDAPPFKIPGKEARPMLLQGAIMTESEAVEMVAAADADKVNGLRKWLG